MLISVIERRKAWIYEVPLVETHALPESDQQITHAGGSTRSNDQTVQRSSHRGDCQAVSARAESASDGMGRMGRCEGRLSSE